MPISRYTTTSRPQPSRSQPCKAAPACPVCGGLQCLCRPRFFPGQLLTEQDLNRLDRYIREKNRLHNRYLHGWGVVCGLEVTCHPCEDLVQVSSGYALSPCGDDLIVCEDDTVDVCALIQQCCKRERNPCKPHRYARTDDCKDVEETWILALCYEEKPSRGITALRTMSKTGEACCSRCGGTASSCGCGCNEHGHADGPTHGSNYANGASAGTRTATRPTPAQCEPTVICEGYRYAVYRAPDVGSYDEGGALLESFRCCLQPYTDLIQELKRSRSDDQQRVLLDIDLTDLCCSMKQRLREILLVHPHHNCTLLKKLDEIQCSSEATAEEVWQVLYVLVEAYFECMCSALLPPCPAPAEDNCVPLAAVTVRRMQGRCHVLRVCNWTVHRKIATTLPSLQYWLSVFPFGRDFRANLEELCCGLGELFDQRGRREPENDAVDFPQSVSRTEAPASERDRPESASEGSTPYTPQYYRRKSRPFSTIIADALTGRMTPFTPESFFGGLMGQSEKNGGLRSAERTEPLAYLLTEHLARPLIREVVPDALPGAAAFFAASGQEADRADLDALRKQVEALEHRLEEQQTVINELNERDS